MSRNGGIAKGDTHMCDGCIVVGLLEAKRFVDVTLESLDPAALARVQANSHGAGECSLSGKCDCIGECKHGRGGHGAGVGNA